MPEQQQGAGPQQPNVGGQMMMMLILFMGIILLFNQNVRESIGDFVGLGMFPFVGFGGAYPIVTLMVTGMLMIMFSTVLRHFFVDWVEMARNQRLMSAFNKELRKARLDNNTYKIKKLTEIQKDVMAKSLSATQTQIKLLPVTMLVIIPIFAWISVFVSQSIPTSTFSVPWEPNGDLQNSHIFPNWVLIYSLMTIPFGQVISRILKFFSFRKRVKELDRGEGAGNAGDY